MNRFKMINHASVMIEYEGWRVLTDPWYQSNSFGAWYQDPSPNADDVLGLSKLSNLSVVVSHGHDDHLDDFFLSKNLSDNNYFCASFSNDSLFKRLSKVSRNVEEIKDEKNFGPFKIKQFVNEDFTGFDAIIVIKCEEFSVIHANDNWHEWPDKLTKEIKKYIADVNNSFLLIQFGIADCFPVKYLGLTEDDAKQIVEERYSKYLAATTSNLKKLGLSKVFYYANQAKIDGSPLFSIDIKKFYFDYLKQNAKHDWYQLMPGDLVSDDLNVIKGSSDIDFFSYQLNALEKYLNEEYRKISGGDFLYTKLEVDENKADESCINYIASPTVWNRIFTGELNLEALIIGGCGFIKKPKFNISNHHMFVSKVSYKIQNQILKKGVVFFEDIMNENE